MADTAATAGSCIPSRARPGDAAASWSAGATWSATRRGAGPASTGGRSGARSRGSATGAGVVAILLISLTFSLLAAGMIGRGDAGRRRRPGVLGRRPDLAQRRRPVPPDRPVPALRLRPVDAAAVRAVGAAAVGRRLVRVARRDDPAAALDDPLGVPPAAADDRGHRRAPRVPDRREPRHRQHQPAADADAVGGAVHRSAARRRCCGRSRPG